MNGVGRFDPVSVAEQEELIRELRRGHQLTARLQAEALRSLRERGQSEAAAALILQEVSSAFTVCLSIMAGSAPPAGAPPPPRAETPDSGVPSGTQRPSPRDDSVPRKRILTPWPHIDGHEWRKYGQKKIKTSSFQRCYYKCSHHHERKCPATKQVQRHSNGDPPMYDVIYVKEHTCQAPRSEPEAAPASSAANPLEFSAGLLSPPGRLGLDRSAKDEHERWALVSSLACVLQGGYSGGAAPEPPLERIGMDDVSASTSLIDAFELPVMLDVDEELDIMDYDSTAYDGEGAAWCHPHVG